MITLPNGKICMNEQEAIQWLLDNYPIPFQCSADYAANTEIGLGTIVNPTPAKVKIGSIIFFADSKVSTVVGLTANGFICSDQYNDLVDDIVYVSNVAINASGHLITTLSNNTNIDAGLIKQLSGLSINASQHLIATYNDGTTSDLGAIFNGNVNIAGNLTADSIIENMGADYYFTNGNVTGVTIDYAGICKNGNKLTFALAGSLTKNENTPYNLNVGNFHIPEALGALLVPMEATTIDVHYVSFIKASSLTSTPINKVLQYSKDSNRSLKMQIVGGGGGDIELNTKYVFRWEVTFLLSQNLAA